MNQQLHDFYSAKARTLEAEIKLLRQRGRYFVIGQLTAFVAAFGCIAVYTVSDKGMAWIVGALIMLTMYIAIRKTDGRNSNRIRSMESLRTVYDNEARYQQEDFSPFDDGQRYVDPHHPFTFDLDIFGKQSLYQRLCRCVTTGGADELAHNLSTVNSRETSATDGLQQRRKATAVDSLQQRREAMKELAAMEPWRARFMAFGQERRMDTNEIASVIQAASQLQIPRWFGSTGALAMVYLVLGGFYLTVMLAVLGVISGSVPFVWGVAQLMVIVGLASKSVKTVTKAAGRLHRQLSIYVDLIRHIGSAEFRSPELQSLQGRLAGENGSALSSLLGTKAGHDGSALHSFMLLESLVRGIDQRSNEAGIVIFNTFALFDFFLVRRFLRWQALYLNRIGEWMAAISQLDMLVSMATYLYNHPEAQDATVTDDTISSQDSPAIFHAVNLRHPFLGSSAVGNDITIDSRHFYIITGANMAGKSTFLRSVGISYVMAMQGLPVFADNLTVSHFQLFTSMRTTDDLANGISYFNAELLRLRQLIDSLSSPTLIILDEILKGTNSLDKLNGSRLFLQTMAQKDVTGIVATHDLELSKMADENPDRFHNFCFEIELGDSVTYSYHITPGVARNQNATFLLRGILEHCNRSVAECPERA